MNRVGDSDRENDRRRNSRYGRQRTRNGPVLGPSEQSCITFTKDGEDVIVINGDCQKPVVLVIDEDSIDNGNAPNFFTDVQVNDDRAGLGQRSQLQYFKNNVVTQSASIPVRWATRVGLH